MTERASPATWLEELSEEVTKIQGGGAASTEKLEFVRRLPSGLSRQVWLCVFSPKDAQKQHLVLAFGNDSSVAKGNEAILQRLPDKIRDAFVRTYLIVDTPGRNSYIQIMEYLTGATLNHLLSSAGSSGLRALVRSTYRSVCVVHSHSDELMGSQHGTYWDTYHWPRIDQRIRQLQQWDGPLVNRVLDEGFLVARGETRWVIPPINQTISGLNRRARILDPSSRVLVHGDFKPENIVVAEDVLHFIDPQLHYGDPCVDLARLYCWLLTDSLLSGNSEAALTEPSGGTFGVAFATEASKLVCRLEWSPSRNAKMAGAELMIAAETDGLDRTRFELCAGSTLIWQAGRLLDLSSEALSSGVATGDCRKAAPVAHRDNIAGVAFVTGAIFLTDALELAEGRRGRLGQGEL
jgi:hypothetical protein